MANDYHPITAEQLIEALTYSRGLISPARFYLIEKYKFTLDRGTMQKRIKEWGMEDWISDLQKDLVEDCLSRRFMKALEDGDSAANAWVVAKYGHHASFLKMKEDEDPEQKAPVDVRVVDFGTVYKSKEPKKNDDNSSSSI